MNIRKRKDSIFILVLALTVGNLTYYVLRDLYLMIQNNTYGDIITWTLLVADAVAIVGALWLLRSNRKARRQQQR